MVENGQTYEKGHLYLGRHHFETRNGTSTLNFGSLSMKYGFASVVGGEGHSHKRSALPFFTTKDPHDETIINHF